MRHPLYLVPGLVLAAAGFALLFWLLASQQALAKSKQLKALGELTSGRAGQTKRRLSLAALAAMAFGACGTFAGVGANDSARTKACVRSCADRGYETGKIRGSEKQDPAARGRHAFVACACERGPAPDPLELRADDLDY